MFTSFLASTLFALAAASPQYGDNTSSSSSSSAQNHTTTADGAHIIKLTPTFTFEPSSMTVPVGSWLEFQFWPQNHSVVQAAFAKPCEPLDDGFFSGFFPVAADVAEGERPSFRVEVKDDKPIWLYCSAAKHCQNGMVGVVNPPAQGANTLEAFTKAAAAVADNKSPSNLEATGGTVGKVAAGNADNSTSDTSGAGRIVGSVGLAGMVGLVAAAWGL